MYAITTSLVGAPPSEDADAVALRRYIRTAETEWKKVKAVLEQKNEQLELQVKEAREREESLRKMNNAFLATFEDVKREKEPTQAKLARELEIMAEKHAKELVDVRAKATDSVKQLERETRELKERLTQTELSSKDSVLAYEKKVMMLEQRLATAERERSNLSMMAKLHEEERKQSKELVEYELQMRLSDMRKQIDAIKEETLREAEKAKREYEREIEGLKRLHENERQLMQTRMQMIANQCRVDVLNFEVSTQTECNEQLNPTWEEDLRRLEESERRNMLLQSCIQRLRSQLSVAVQAQQSISREVQEKLTLLC
eukprot:TRINITY_DN3911_c0_g1_i1.p2 TRINITY_DN3911_c0_g1~~TRINITY_DN3911_c0_g1_i1.p2  ORF type:complete len:315 (-),score=115.27 TRINITY_DN3911_c0_g1_i1:1680-2624(-)